MKVSSCVLHPFPGGPAAERQPDHQERRGPEQSGIERPIQPAAGEDADQHRHDDDPAEHADLGETARRPRDRPRAAPRRSRAPRSRTPFTSGSSSSGLGAGIVMPGFPSRCARPDEDGA